MGIFWFHPIWWPVNLPPPPKKKTRWAREPKRQTRHTQADIQNAQVSFTDPLPPLKFRAVVLLFLSPKRRNIWYGSSHQLGFSPRDTRIKKEMVQLSAPVKLGCGNRRVSCRHLSPGWKFTFQWFTSSWPVDVGFVNQTSGPLYSKTPAPTSHSHSLKTSKVEPLFFSRKIGNSTFQWFTSSWPLYSKTPATTSHSHSLNTSKVESLFFPKNWQLYFSVVYLFLTPLQQNSGHHIPFPQPENLKSRVPFFSEKLATLLFSGLPLLDPSTAKLRPLHPIPTAWKPQK